MGWLVFNPNLADSYIEAAMSRLMIENAGFWFSFLDSLSPDTRSQFTDAFYYDKNEFKLSVHIKEISTTLKVIELERNKSLKIRFQQKLSK